MVSQSKSILSRYAAAAVIVVVATFLTKKTQPLLGEISPFFFVAVMLAAWFGGVGPGLLATALAGFASAIFFYDIPAGTGIFGWDDVLRLSVFLMGALLISFLLNMRRNAEKQLRIANEHLEIRVLERTRALETSNRKLRESEEGLKALIDGVTDCAICMLDQTGHVTQWNSGAQRIQGYNDREIDKKHFSIFSPQQDRMDRDGQLSRAAKTGRDDDEGWRVRKDGSHFWAYVIITPLYDESHQLRGYAHVARDITELKRLEKEVIEVSEREQRRIGQDLHDGLGQELTGLAFLSQNVARKLSDASRSEAAELSRISNLINLAIEKTRDVAKGLAPVEWGSDGLSAALQNLSVQTKELYGIPCEFHRGRSAKVDSHASAVHLYRIAQEALSNAARHSQATNISLSMDGDANEIVLCIEDNGIGLGTDKPASTGMGLHLMPYRARMIGATFEIEPRNGGGTRICCVYRNDSETMDQR